MKIFKNYQVWVLGLTLAFASCASNDEKVEEYNTLFGQIMQVHDEVMPKMMDISSLKGELQNRAESDTTATASYNEAILKLDKADAHMETWMMEFADEFVPTKSKVQSMSEEELNKVIAGLKAELDEVNEVKSSINTSIDNAKSLVQ